MKTNPFRHAVSQFVITKPFVIGIDSDGTVFDTMDLKQRTCFIPQAIETWNLQPIARQFEEVACFINLYSRLRGLNRFPALALAFDYLAERADVVASGVELPDATDLRAFCNADLPLSVKSLQAYVHSQPSPFLTQVIGWSQRSDQRMSDHTALHGAAVYSGVRQALTLVRKDCHIMVISSASRANLTGDWTDAGLISHVDLLAGQEMGGKAAQIKHATVEKIPHHRGLMIGDAIGDLEAARANDLLFFPILPGREVASWELFAREGYPRFVAGTFAGPYAAQLLADFETALPDESHKPWALAAPARRDAAVRV